MGAAAECDQAAGGRPGHEQCDQAQRLGCIVPVPIGKVDPQPRRVAAHEGDEQTAEMQKADAVDIAGQRTQRTGQNKNTA
jgi:hypothetical protein